MNTISKLVLILFIFGSVTFTSCQKDDINDLIEKVKHSNNGDEEGDGDGRDGEVAGKESDSGARDGGGGSGMGGGVLGI